MYRDLKPENILISAQGHIRLSDFDLVRSITTTARIAGACSDHVEQAYLQASVEARSFVGTAEYVAPEVIQRKPYELAAEWWSIGILTYEMVSGYTPFVGENTQQTFRRILHAQLVFRDDVTLSRDCRDFITGCLQRDPSLRLGSKRSAAELKGHKWMQHVCWPLLANTERPPYLPNMPLLPECAEGAEAGNDSVVADRYRLYGRHFNSRGAAPEQKVETGRGRDEAALDGQVADPFEGFDFIRQ
jgi:protein-serine/threonine kinase